MKAVAEPGFVDRPAGALTAAAGDRCGVSFFNVGHPNLTGITTHSGSASPPTTDRNRTAANSGGASFYPFALASCAIPTRPAVNDRSAGFR